MTIHFQTSSEPQDCTQCMNLGLPSGTIDKNEVHLVMSHENVSLACCADCFARLSEEVEQEESEAWKVG